MLHPIHLVLLPLLLFPLLTAGYPGSLPSFFSSSSDTTPAVDITKIPFVGKGPVSTRSPCPMLNVLANHNIIPYSGKDITKDQLKSAFEMLGLSWLLRSTLVEGGFSKAGHKLADGTVALNLADLQKHNLIEHDVSYTRQDDNINHDPTTLDPKLFAQLLTFGKTDASTPEPYLDVVSLADARQLRQLQSDRDNPKVDFGLNRKIFALMECAMILDIMGRDGKVPASVLKSFFVDERFPAGWVPPDGYTYVKKLYTTAQCELYQGRNPEVTLEWEKKVKL